MTELDQLATHLFECYYSDLLRFLYMNDVNFILALHKHELLNGDVQNALLSVSTTSEKASYFLENVMKPGINYEKFRKLLSAMKNSIHNNVIDLAYQLQLQLILLQNNNTEKVKSKCFILRMCSYIIYYTLAIFYYVKYGLH